MADRCFALCPSRLTSANALASASDLFPSQSLQDAAASWAGSRGSAYISQNPSNLASQEINDLITASDGGRQGRSPLAWLMLHFGHVQNSAVARTLQSSGKVKFTSPGTGVSL